MPGLLQAGIASVPPDPGVPVAVGAAATANMAVQRLAAAAAAAAAAADVGPAAVAVTTAPMIPAAPPSALARDPMSWEADISSLQAGYDGYISRTKWADARWQLLDESCLRNFIPQPLEPPRFGRPDSRAEALGFLDVSTSAGNTGCAGAAPSGGSPTTPPPQPPLSKQNAAGAAAAATASGSSGGHATNSRGGDATVMAKAAPSPSQATGAKAGMPTFSGPPVGAPPPPPPISGDATGAPDPPPGLGVPAKASSGIPPGSVWN